MNIQNVFGGVVLVFTLALSACGGGGSSSDGVVIEGQVTQGEAVEHVLARDKHGADEPLENVKVCALGRCSVTDGEGMYGFVAPSDFEHGDVLFTIEGHGIVAETVVHLLPGSDLFVHLQSSNSQEVHLHHVLVDGVRYEPEELMGEHHHE